MARPPPISIATTGVAYAKHYIGNGYFQTAQGIGKWATMYGRYRIDAVMWSYTLEQVSSGASPLVAYMWADDKEGDPTTEVEILQRPFLRRVVIPADNSSRRISIKVKPWKVLGVPFRHYINDDYFSASTANMPPRKMYIHFAVCTSVSGGTLHVIESLKQRYRFYDRIEDVSQQ